MCLIMCSPRESPTGDEHDYLSLKIGVLSLNISSDSDCQGGRDGRSQAEKRGLGLLLFFPWRSP